MLNMQAIGTNFNWTLNQEKVFSATHTGKPVRKEEFSEYCWKGCVIGTSRDYAMALYKDDWNAALRRGDLSMLMDVNDEPLIFCPANNTEYLNVASTWKHPGDAFGPLFATITSHSSDRGQYHSMEA